MPALLAEPQLGPDTSWGSHLVPLMACITATRGPVLEVGIGHWSTPLLHRYCVAAGRRLVSIESDREWAKLFMHLNVSHHQVQAASYNESLERLAGEDWSVVFLDHSPGFRRAHDALPFLDRAEFIVVHDFAEDVKAAFTADVLDHWSHRAVAEFSPKTLVLGKREIPSW